MAVYKRERNGCCEKYNTKIYQRKPCNIAADEPPDTLCGSKDEKQNKTVKGGFIASLADDLFDGGIDSDKLLIAALLYLLIKEGADIKLIIALGYILM